MYVEEKKGGLLMNIFKNINLLQNLMDISTLRQRLITNNIANVDTP